MDIVFRNFKKWNDALMSKDSKKVMALYAEDHSFHPTVDGEFRRGLEKVEEYFERHFLWKNPSGEVVDEHFLTLSDEAYFHSGMYNFEVDSVTKKGKVILDKKTGKTKRKTLNARFTFIWMKDGNGDWKIIHHHSSEKPVVRRLV
jgi:hypothetical protein